MPNIKIRCSGCNKGFPVNLKKHLNRDYRFCPFCRTKVKIKIDPFFPSIDWLKEKALNAITKVMIKRAARRPRYSKQEEYLLRTHEDEATDLHKSLFKKPSKGKRA